MRILPFLILYFSFSPIFSQNLIPNGDFETINFCPNSVGQISACANWQSIQCSPDYFHQCGTNGFSVPNSAFGYQISSGGGNGYVGMFCYLPAPFNQREYFGVSLSDTLKSGNSYKLSLDISLANISMFAVNKIGAVFSSSPLIYSSVCDFRNLLTNISFNNIVTDTMNWVSLTDTVVASGGESFVSFGVFYPDSAIDTLRVKQNGNGAYYYYDNISLTELPLSIGEHRRFDMELLPNPSPGLFTLRKLPVALKRVKLSMLSAEGRIIEEELLDVHNRSVTFQSKSPPGFYMLRITDADGEQGFGLKKVIIQ